VNYRIRVSGHLDPSWSEWFDGLVITNLESGDTVLTGPVIDQAELHGLLVKIRDLGLSLVEVQQEDPAASLEGPQRLYLLQVATGIVPLPSGQTLTWPVVCYLVETSHGKHILIDSGYPADFQPLPGTPPPAHERTVIEQLADLGLHPNDIDILVCTHFDVDHAGYHDTFPHAELIVQREHYELARSGHPRYAPVRAHWDHPALQYRLIDGDVELLPGLILLETGGHAPGHQSVLVRLPQTGPVLLTIDAVPLERLFRPNRRATPADDNAEQLRTSTRKLLDLVAQEHVALVIFGHDGEQWQTLKKVPAFYH
jgi:N-acyl homoserine lactone hydrolase